MNMRGKMLMALLVGSSCLLSSEMLAPAFAADAPAPSAPAERVQLPQTQEYMRTLRTYMATLKEKDFDHGVTAQLAVPPVNPDKEFQYRNFILAMQQPPHVGGKRGTPAVNMPPKHFLLDAIETEKAVFIPPVWPESLGTFIEWDSAGNVFRDNKALKMRAFVAGAVKLIMTDNHLDVNATSGITRADWNGYHLIASASSYPVFKGVLPPEVQKAYEAGLMRLGRKMIAKGPTGAEADYELGVAVGLWYIARATGDAEFTKEAEAYAKKLCTDPRYAHPAGYWVEANGLDVGFGGMPNFWVSWLALASKWPFAQEATERAYRLKAHLILPEPDGKLTGPSAFNTRLGSPASEDQWDWDRSRDHAAAMVTDEAVFLITKPTPEQLAGSVEARTGIFSSHLYGPMRNAPFINPDRSGRVLEESELRNGPWRWAIFPNGFNYPIEVNPGYDHYRKDAWAHLEKLQKENSPMLKSPYLREGDFTRNFGDAFVSVKRKNFAVILHVGPVGDPAPSELMSFYKGPLGWGGGQLSAFWTPDAGAALLARRSGFAMHGANPVYYDKWDEWRTWPLHAVTGATADGKVFTSARISKPQTTVDAKPERTEAKVAGDIPQTIAGQEGGLAGKLQYKRAFTIDDKGVRIETTVSGDGKDSIAEMYETIPVFHCDTKNQPQAKPALIEFQIGGKWSPASDAWAESVQAVRVTRFNGSVLVTFESPKRVKLSPKDWADVFLTRGTARNVLIDMLGGSQPSPVKEARTVAYRIEPVAK